MLFVNGRPIARHGVFRPQKPEEPLPFACCIPPTLLQPGAENEIAVEVYREQTGVTWEFAPVWEPMASVGVGGKEGQEGERGDATPSQGGSDTHPPTHQPTTMADLRLAVVSDRTTVPLGQQDLPVTLHFTHAGGRAARIVSARLAFWQDGVDVSEHYMVWPKTPPPATVAPGGPATQEFLVDTFDDTPVGEVEVRPRVVWCDAAADLLTNGSFEPDGPDPSAAWQPGPDLKGEGAAVRVVRSQEAERRIVKVAAPPYNFSNTGDLCADGAACLKITPGLGVAEGFRTVFESQPVPVEPGQVYVLGGQSYHGAELRAVELDAAGKVVAERGRGFGVEWDPIVHAWTSVRLAWQTLPETVAVRVQLRSVAEVNWWDGLYLVPADRLWTYEWSEPSLVWEVQAPQAGGR